MSIVNSKIIYDKSLYMQTWNIKYFKPSNIKAHVWKKFDKCFLHFKNNPKNLHDIIIGNRLRYLKKNLSKFINNKNIISNSHDTELLFYSW